MMPWVAFAASAGYTPVTPTTTSFSLHQDRLVQADREHCPRYSCSQAVSWVWPLTEDKSYFQSVVQPSTATDEISVREDLMIIKMMMNTRALCRLHTQ
jgi:hypothetical protein